MNEEIKNNVHWSFWLITIFMLIWNVMGCINFIMQNNPDMLSMYRETEQAIIHARPAWATVGFAFAVFGGTLGCLLLIFRNSIAMYVFIVSLLGVLVTMAHTLSSGISFSIGELAGIIFMPTAVAVFLIGYSIFARTKGWLST